MGWSDHGHWRRRGTTNVMIVWEGFRNRGTIQIPHDITVMVFECKYNLPQNLIAGGYQIINTSWKPLYVVQETAEKFRCWSPRYIYGWNRYRWENWWNQSLAYPDGINVKPSDQVIGAQMCSWGLAGNREVPYHRQRLWGHCVDRGEPAHLAKTEAGVVSWPDSQAVTARRAAPPITPKKRFAAPPDIQVGGKSRSVFQTDCAQPTREYALVPQCSRCSLRNGRACGSLRI